MNKAMIAGILQAHSKLKRPIKITVMGFSMNPTLYEGDCITVLSQDSYQVGDILVFRYKQDELLVHRLLEIKNNTYYCKGDNAFRLEDIKVEQITGKVIEATRGETSLKIDISDKALQLSLEVNREFVMQRYSIEKTMKTQINGLYQAEITGAEIDAT